LDPNHAQQVCFRLCLYKGCLQSFDGLFSSLRSQSATFESTEQHVEKVQGYLDAALKCWRCLKMTIMPKLHLLEDQNIDFVQQFETIKDYHEEYVEQLHQTDMKLDKMIKMRDVNNKIISKLEMAM
jgi:hypothetical protein